MRTTIGMYIQWSCGGERQRPARGRAGERKANTHHLHSASVSLLTSGMGGSQSASASAPALADDDRDVLSTCTGATPYAADDPLWARVIAFRHPLHLTDPGQIHLATRGYCERMGTEVWKRVLPLWSRARWPAGAVGALPRAHSCLFPLFQPSAARGSGCCLLACVPH